MAYIAFWRPNDEDPYPQFGQWWLSDFALTPEVEAKFPEDISQLSLIKEKPHVLEKLNCCVFNTAEKFMMMGKAALFNDNVVLRKMAQNDNPKLQKKLGREVRNFDNDTWNRYCQDIVKIGNYLKFSQDEKLCQILLNTNDAILVEGSPLDKIWGVGLKYDHPDISNPKRWRGTNYLGNCLMFVRNVLRK